MKAEDVEAEWVNLMADAIFRLRSADRNVKSSDLARTALAAVAPEIAARERAECRRVAVSVAHQFEQDDPRHETGWAIADAIRARGEG